MIIILWNQSKITRTDIDTLVDAISASYPTVAVRTGDYNAPDIRIWDLERLPEQDVKELLRIVTGELYVRNQESN